MSRADVAFAVVVGEFEAWQMRTLERLSALRRVDAQELERAEAAVLEVLLARRREEHQTILRLYAAATCVIEDAERIQARIVVQGREARVSRLGELQGWSNELDRLAAVFVEQHAVVEALERILAALPHANSLENDA
jgi:hypothetical protein